MKKLLFYSAFICLLLFILSGCRKENHHPVNFYYWKSNVSIDPVEKEYFTALDAKKLYIRYFDVDKVNDEIVPKAKIKTFCPYILTTSYIPVIFITNRTFSDISLKENDDLARKTYTLIQEIEKYNSIPKSGEIQIDCDWTESTRSAYFHFLKSLEKISGRQVSVTLRLHQVKYKDKTGIPPVSKAFLMCYATSNPTEKDVKNSILDIRLLKDYTKNIQHYPLKLDIALPIYSWAVVTNHLGKIKLINGVTENDLQSSLFKHLEGNNYEILEDAFFRGMYLNKGFTIRVEDIDAKLLDEAKKYIDKKLKTDYDIVYYHLDKSFLEKFTIDQLK